MILFTLYKNNLKYYLISISSIHFNNITPLVIKWGNVTLINRKIIGHKNLTYMR